MPLTSQRSNLEGKYLKSRDPEVKKLYKKQNKIWGILLVTNNSGQQFWTDKGVNPGKIMLSADSIVAETHFQCSKKSWNCWKFMYIEWHCWFDWPSWYSIKKSLNFILVFWKQKEGSLENHVLLILYKMLNRTL